MNVQKVGIFHKQQFMTRLQNCYSALQSMRLPLVGSSFLQSRPRLVIISGEFVGRRNTRF